MKFMKAFNEQRKSQQILHLKMKVTFLNLTSMNLHDELYEEFDLIA